ncbi:MAG: PT domain-containing protein [Chloroflexota bacterium]|nr:PT domain-containing protein [Chloroflexota bacterium]
MKKSIFLFVVLVFALVACEGGEPPSPAPEPTEVVAVEAEPTEVLPEPTAEPTEVPPEPTAEPTLEPTEEPTVAPTEMPTANDVVIEWLNDAEVVFEECADAMAENEGGQFGAGATKTYNADDDVFAFGAENGGIWMPLNTHLDQFGGMEANGEQAILIKFQPLPPFSLSFTFMGPNEFGVDFWGGGKPSLFWVVEAWKDPFDGNLALEEGGWYYTLMAIDREGNFRSVVWEENNPDNKATFSEAFAERDQGDGYKNQSWKFIIGSNAPMTLNVAEYKVYKFSGFSQ